MISTISIEVTEAAITYFQHLLEKEDTPGMNLRVFVANPGTIHADVGVTFCLPEAEASDDIPLEFDNFTLFVEEASQAALENAKIDFKNNAVGGELSIHAPYLKGRPLNPEATLREHIQQVIESEINPSLGSHGGRVSIVDILEKEGIVVLQFGGGCHGCGMANVTLKQGIEKTLKERFPEIQEVRDATDHSTGENPYC